MIIGENINLRLFNSEDDVHYYFSALNNLEERSITDHTEISSLPMRIKTFHENGFWSQKNGTLLITSKEDKIIGTIGFCRKTEFELSIGYRIPEKINRGRGFMTEALQMFSSYLFETVPLITRLSLYTAEDNTASRKLAEKCGYKEEGILRNAYFYRGKICNWVIYSLLREECS